jgi:predicted small metal-binding protein
MVAGPAGYYEEDQKGGTMAEPISVKCPSCQSDIRAADESGLVSVLQEHLYEEHALEMPRERVRENVYAQLKDFDGYNARPISGA